MIAGILLAAGQSKRFRTYKLLHEVGGNPLLYYSLKPCLDSRLSAVYIVVGSREKEIGQALEAIFGTEPRIRIIKNEHPERGLMSSLKGGLRVLGKRYDAAMVLLADMPFVHREAIDRLIRVFEKENAIVVPESGGEPSHPRIIPRRYFPEFLRLGDDERGSNIIDSHKDDLVLVNMSDPQHGVDIDRPEDLDPLAF
jgi:molybdenum cofactor cytidylyltransferase